MSRTYTATLDSIQQTAIIKCPTMTAAKYFFPRRTESAVVRFSGILRPFRRLYCRCSTCESCAPAGFPRCVQDGRSTKLPSSSYSAGFIRPKNSSHLANDSLFHTRTLGEFNVRCQNGGNADRRLAAGIEKVGADPY